MRTIDVHAHLVPRNVWQAAEAKRDWYGYRHEPGEGLGTFVANGKRSGFTSPKVRFTPEERLKDMDAQGVDVQVVSIHTPFFGYHLDPAQGRALAREVNDEIAALTKQWPRRFAGLATLPVQDVKVAIDELERAVTVLGLKGAELDTIVNGDNWDEPKFLPLFKAAEAMGAVLFFHPQPQLNFMLDRTTRYGLNNSLGVIVEDAIAVAMLIFGGVLDACPNLKACIAHGGGPACYAMGRMDRGWQGRPDSRVVATLPGHEPARVFVRRRGESHRVSCLPERMAGHRHSPKRRPDLDGEPASVLAVQCRARSPLRARRNRRVDRSGVGSLPRGERQ